MGAVKKTIFRKYDIRGIAQTELSDKVVTRIGQAYATMVRRQAQTAGALQVGIGYDARASSPRLLEALSTGIRRAGLGVLNLGLVPTPLVYFAQHTRDGLAGVIQITGSHNPAEYNGFKMMIGKDTLHGEAIASLYDLIQLGDVVESETYGAQTTWGGLVEAYIDWVDKDITASPRPLKVVLDSGNGVAGVVAPACIRQVFPQAEVVELFSQPDATFPNHHPDPTIEANLAHLIAKVKEVGADLGVAYDGDGDRIGVVDEQGQVIWGDRLLILLGRAVLRDNPGATIIGEVKCSQTLFDDIQAHGGTPVMSAVGHSLIKAKIKETGAKLAGEMSGHIFFNDRFFGFDDAIYTTARLLEILGQQSDPLSQLMDDVPKTFATPELRVECAEALKFAVPGRIATAFGSRGLKVNAIDGARVQFDHGWGLVRASNTQPALVLRVEATTELLRDEYLGQLYDELEQQGVKTP